MAKKATNITSRTSRISTTNLSEIAATNFFGFRLPIPFENPLALTAAVAHYIMYPERIVPDEMGVLSLQKLLQFPTEFTEILHNTGIDALSGRQVVTDFAATSLTGVSVSDTASKAGKNRKEINRTVTGNYEFQTPFLRQFSQCFVQSDQKDNQIKFLHWLKEILVLYEHKVEEKGEPTYVFYPYHPYLLKQVKRFGPIGQFMRNQFAQWEKEYGEMRQGLLDLMVPIQEDYISAIVRPILLHEYAIRIADIERTNKNKNLDYRFVLVPNWPSQTELFLYELRTNRQYEFWNNFDLSSRMPEIGNDKLIEIVREGLKTRIANRSVISLVIFRPGLLPQDDLLDYFEFISQLQSRGDQIPKLSLKPLNMEGNSSLKFKDLSSQRKSTQAYQTTFLTDEKLGGQSTEISKKIIIKVPYMKTVMEDITRVSSLPGLDRFERLKWIDSLLNFHLALYILRRGVRNCNCWHVENSPEAPSSCAPFYAAVDCVREFRGELAGRCYDDFGYLRYGVIRNYRQFIEWRLHNLNTLPPDIKLFHSRKELETAVREYWVNTLNFTERTYKGFLNSLDRVYSHASEGKTSTELWADACLDLLNGTGGDLWRIFSVVNVHGRNIGFVEPTTGRNSRRKLTLTPDLLKILIHCLIKPGKRSISFREFTHHLFDRYGLIVNLGDPRWQREFPEAEDRKRMESWTSVMGESNLLALRNMLREAGLLEEYSDTSAEVRAYLYENQAE